MQDCSRFHAEWNSRSEMLELLRPIAPAELMTLHPREFKSIEYLCQKVL